MNLYTYPLAQGIKPSKEFARKKLCEFAVNVGVKCAHDCTYCSTGTMMRMHPAFKAHDRSPFEPGYSIVDPEMPEKVAHDAKHKRQRGLVQLCTIVDAWAPDAQKHDLGRRCLEAILAEPGWKVRILTKNAAVAEDFDVVEKYRDRVLVGLSLTATENKDDVISVTEPTASSISERMAALKKAHTMGLRTYGMLCPLLPGIGDDPQQIDDLVNFCKSVGVEEVFAEAVNSRGPGLRQTEEALRASGCVEEAKAVGAIRKEVNWSPYVVALVRHLQNAMRKHISTTKLRFLLYPSRLKAEDRTKLEKDGAGIIWLRRRHKWPKAMVPSGFSPWVSALGQLLTGSTSIINGNNRFLRSLAKFTPCFNLRRERRMCVGVAPRCRPSPLLLAIILWYQRIGAMTMDVSMTIAAQTDQKTIVRKPAFRNPPRRIGSVRVGITSIGVVDGQEIGIVPVAATLASMICPDTDSPGCVSPQVAFQECTVQDPRRSSN